MSTLDIQVVNPKNYGWLQLKLPPDVVNHIWNCVDNTHSYKDKLVGHIESSYKLEDKDDYLWNNVLQECIMMYGKAYSHDHNKPPMDLSVTGSNLAPYLHDFWINYQNKHEFNPVHNHGGLYSFAAWLKIPTDFEEQNKLPNAQGVTKSKFNSAFCFQYTNIFGQIKTCTYQLNPTWENTFLFFPSSLQHCVYPFYECDEQRISISGNIMLK